MGKFIELFCWLCNVSAEDVAAASSACSGVLVSLHAVTKSIPAIIKTDCILAAFTWADFKYTDFRNAGFRKKLVGTKLGVLENRVFNGLAHCDFDYFKVTTIVLPEQNTSADISADYYSVNETVNYIRLQLVLYCIAL